MPLSRSAVPHLALAILGLASLLAWPALNAGLRFNLVSQRLLLVMGEESQQVVSLDAELQKWASENCRAAWFAALLGSRLGEATLARERLGEAVSCSSVNLPFAQVMASQDIELAERAVQSHPNSADAWFWTARLYASEAPVEAVQKYRRGLELNPHDGLAWRELGDLLVENDPEAAIEAYLQSCYNGDPGFHGCLRAGNTAAQQGDIEAAITYYRLSDWPSAHEKADHVEQQLLRHTSP